MVLVKKIYNAIIVIMKIVQSDIKRTNSFSTFSTNSLRVGDSTIFDIFIKKSEKYIIIIEAGTILSSKLLEKLKKQDKLYISEKDETKQELTCKSLKYYIKHNKDNLEKTLNFLYEINTKMFTEFLNSKENQIDVDCVESLVRSIIFMIKSDQNYLKNTITHFANENELELPIHSLHVCILSVNLGNIVKLNNEHLSALGTAALLHDVGIKKINESIMLKSEKLSLEEVESLHQHPQYGADIVKHNQILDPYVIDAITHHHENYDGSGYPDNLYARHISDLASIVSISDVFDALTNDRPYRKAYSSFDAIKMMMKDESMVNKFNHKYLQYFLQSLMD